MKTFSGKDAPLPDNDTPADVIDVVFHLGREKRFGGWGNSEWSVLHHSMLTALLWAHFYGPDGMHYALLHDAHEAYTGDIPSPVKAFMGKSEVKALEHGLDERIRATVGIAQGPGEADQKRIKLVDQAALIIEAYYFGTPGSFHLIGETNWRHSIGITPDDRTAIRGIIKLTCPEVMEAMDMFLPTAGLANSFKAVYA